MPVKAGDSVRLELPYGTSVEAVVSAVVGDRALVMGAWRDVSGLAPGSSVPFRIGGKRVVGVVAATPKKSSSKKAAAKKPASNKPTSA